MSLPGNVTTITVTGSFYDLQGNALSGTVQFIASASPFADPTAPAFLSGVTVTATLSNGAFSVVLPCTDNTTLSPTGFVYTVVETVSGDSRQYLISLPHTLGATVDLAAIAPVTTLPTVSPFGVLALANTWTGTNTFTGGFALGPTSIATPPGGTADFLRADGTWAAPAGGVQIAGDLGGTNASPQVVGTHLSAPLPLAQGGTAAATQQAAINSLTGAQSSGKYLRSDGTNAALSGLQAADVTGTLAITQGGTGQGSQQAAINALTGSQSSGHYLRSDGTNASLAAIAAGDLPTGTTGAQGALRLDGNASDLQPQGTANAGATGLAADGGHTHPLEAWRFSVMAAGAKGDGKLSNTGATTASSSTVTIGEAVLTAGDVGKVVAVKNALQDRSTSGQTTAVGTITAVNSSTSFTATFNTTPTQTASGLQVLWGTDDTAAVQSTIASANTYAGTHGVGEVFFPAPAGLFYAIGGVLKNTDGTNAVYNSQLTIPVNAEHNSAVTLIFRGVGDGGQTRYWNSTYPALSGSPIVSFGVFTSSTAQSNSINGLSGGFGGNPSVIGGGTGKNGYGVGTPTPLYSNTCVVFQDISILTTHSNSGWTYSAANMFGIARFHARNFTYGTTGVIELFNGNNGDFTNVTLLAGGLAVGLLMPSNGNNASNYLNNVVCNGGYTYGLVAMEHTVGNDVTILYCWSGICPCGAYGDSAASGTVSALHASWFDQLCVEACTYHINVFGSGAASIGPIVHWTMDTEGTIQFRDNPSNGASLNTLTGEIRITGSPSAITVATGTGFLARVIKEQISPGVASAPPALSANTAVMNNLWRPATVYLTGGANLTTIQVSALAGGNSVPAVSTVADFTAAGTISVPFPVRVGPGQYVKINTSSGTTIPTAVWVLD